MNDLEKATLEILHVNEVIEKTTGYTEVDKIKASAELSTFIKDLLKEFLDTIREYELESGSKICLDDRDSEEFVEIFLSDTWMLK